MSKKMTVHTSQFEFTVEDFNGTIHVHRTPRTPPPGQRASTLLMHTDLMLSLSPEEATYLAGALNTVAGNGTPLEPKEKIQMTESEASSRKKAKK